MYTKNLMAQNISFSENVLQNKKKNLLNRIYHYTMAHFLDDLNKNFNLGHLSDFRSTLFL